jgi:hypothetical protein
VGSTELNPDPGVRSRFDEAPRVGVADTGVVHRRPLRKKQQFGRTDIPGEPGEFVQFAEHISALMTALLPNRARNPSNPAHGSQPRTAGRGAVGRWL